MHVVVMGPVDVMLALCLTLDNNVLNRRCDVQITFVMAITSSRRDLKNSSHM
jgi:hypothetical protein